MGKFIYLTFKRFGSLLVILVSLNSCHYYKLDTITQNQQIQSKLPKEKDRYIIIHTKDSAWHLSGATMDSNEISGQLSQIEPEHLKYLEFKYRSRDFGNYSKKKQWKYNPDSEQPDGELHIYVAENETLSINKEINLSLEDVLLIDIVDEDKIRREKDYVNGGKSIAGFGVLILIVILFK